MSDLFKIHVILLDATPDASSKSFNREQLLLILSIGTTVAQLVDLLMTKTRHIFNRNLLANEFVLRDSYFSLVGDELYQRTVAQIFEHPLVYFVSATIRDLLSNSYLGIVCYCASCNSSSPPKIAASSNFSKKRIRETATDVNLTSTVATAEAQKRTKVESQAPAAQTIATVPTLTRETQSTPTPQAKEKSKKKEGHQPEVKELVSSMIVSKTTAPDTKKIKALSDTKSSQKKLEMEKSKKKESDPRSTVASSEKSPTKHSTKTKHSSKSSELESPSNSLSAHEQQQNIHTLMGNNELWEES